MSVHPRANRGGIGWQEPPEFVREALRPGGFVEFKPLPGESLTDAIRRTQRRVNDVQAAANRAPVPAGTIDMIEVNGVWVER